MKASDSFQVFGSRDQMMNILLSLFGDPQVWDAEDKEMQQATLSEFLDGFVAKRIPGKRVIDLVGAFHHQKNEGNFLIECDGDWVLECFALEESKALALLRRLNAVDDTIVVRWRRKDQTIAQVVQEIV